MGGPLDYQRRDERPSQLNRLAFAVALSPYFSLPMCLGVALVPHELTAALAFHNERAEMAIRIIVPPAVVLLLAVFGCVRLVKRRARREQLIFAGIAIGLDVVIVMIAVLFTVYGPD